MKKLICIRLIFTIVTFAIVVATSAAQSLRIQAPEVLPRSQPLGAYSPLLSFTYSDLKEEPYTLKVWLLEEEDSWNCASSQWCERSFAINGMESANGSLQMTTPFDVFDYPSLMWVARLFNSSGVEVASAKSRCKTLNAESPVLRPIGKHVGFVGQQLRLVFSAKALPEGKVTYRLHNSPAAATFNAETGVFTWTPTATGLYRIVVEAVSPTKLTDAEIVPLDIGQAEEIPSLATEKPGEA